MLGQFGLGLKFEGEFGFGWLLIGGSNELVSAEAYTLTYIGHTTALAFKVRLLTPVVWSCDSALQC